MSFNFYFAQIDYIHIRTYVRMNNYYDFVATLLASSLNDSSTILICTLINSNDPIHSMAGWFYYVCEWGFAAQLGGGGVG